jgi:polyhydroxybutyrate depolymerase
MLDDLASRVHIDRARIYATGLSNGDMMAFRLGVEAPDRIAAIAPVDGALMVDTSGPGRPMPLMMFNSIDDRFVPYAGRVGHTPRAIRVSRASMTSSNDGASSTVARPHRGSDRRSRVRRTRLTREIPRRATNGVLAGTGTLIVLWKLAGSGHVWPGTMHSLSLLGRSTTGISANDQMWQFFRDFSLPSDKRSLERQQTTGG